MTFPDLGVCANCHHHEHGRCAALLRDVACTCVDGRCVADRERLRRIEGPAAEQRYERKTKERKRLSGLSDSRTPRNDPRIAAHEQVEVVVASPDSNSCRWCPFVAKNTDGRRIHESKIHRSEYRAARKAEREKRVAV